MPRPSFPGNFRANCQQDWALNSFPTAPHNDTSPGVVNSSQGKMAEGQSTKADVEQGVKDGAADCTVVSPFSHLDQDAKQCFAAEAEEEDTAQALPPAAISRRRLSRALGSGTVRVSSVRSVGNMDGHLGMAAVSLNAMKTAYPESFRVALPFTQMFHAHKFSDPLLYRKRQPASLAFWAIDIAIPAAVLALGIVCSICTLLGVASAFAVH